MCIRDSAQTDYDAPIRAAISAADETGAEVTVGRLSTLASLSLIHISEPTRPY